METVPTAVRIASLTPSVQARTPALVTVCATISTRDADVVTAPFAQASSVHRWIGEAAASLADRRDRGRPDAREETS